MVVFWVVFTEWKYRVPINEFIDVSGAGTVGISAGLREPAR